MCSRTSGRRSCSHAAAYKHVPMMEYYPEEAIPHHIAGSYNVLSSAVKYQAKKVIVISTDKAVNPTNVMGAHQAGGRAGGEPADPPGDGDRLRAVRQRAGQPRFDAASVPGADPARDCR